MLTLRELVRTRATILSPDMKTFGSRCSQGPVVAGDPVGSRDAGYPVVLYGPLAIVLRSAERGSAGRAETEWHRGAASAQVT